MTTFPAYLPAFVTTVHVGLAVLRKHRLPAGVFPWALLPSVVLCATPWVFSSFVPVAIGGALHLVWFVACEKLIPVPVVAHAAGTRSSSLSSPAAAAGPTASTSQNRGPAQESREFRPVSVLAVIEESPTIRTFRLARPASFRFEAGQFLTVRVQADGTNHVRCYSISSSPEATGYLEISVKRLGLVSGVLHATLRPGSQLFVKPPAGRFTYPAGDDRPIVLLAGGVGITPLISMLRHGTAADPGRPITLLYSARGSSELAFWDELSWLARRHPHVRLVGTVAEASSDWQDRVGTIDGALIANYVPNAAHSVFLMCGPLGMMHAMRDMLLTLGVPESQVRSEVFQAAAAIGAQPSPAIPEAAGEGPGARPAASAVRLEFAKSGLAVDVAPSQTLLDAAEAAGAGIPSLCRAGVCGTCRTRVVSGDVRCTSDALDDSDRQAGYILPCVSWAQGDCVLEA